MMKNSDPTKKRLQPKQLALVDILLKTETISVAEAGRQAGYSAKNAEQTASRALVLPHVAAYYQAQLAKRAQRTGIDADYVLTRLAAIDTMDVADIYDDEGKLLPIKQWPLLWRQMVKEIDMKTGKVKLQDKLRTIELIGKHVGVRAFAEQVQHSGEVIYNVVTGVPNEDAGDN
jgi:phage terminase small subunit